MKCLRGRCSSSRSRNRSSHFRIIGVIFSSDSTFVEHYKDIISRGHSSLGLIHRMVKYFPERNTFRFLYCTLVRPILEYCFFIWGPYFDKYIKYLKRVRHWLLRLVSWHIGQHTHFTNYKVQNDLINCPPILQKINTKVSTLRLRYREFLKVQNGVNRMVINVNSAYFSIDLFNMYDRRIRNLHLIITPT